MAKRIQHDCEGVWCCAVIIVQDQMMREWFLCACVYNYAHLILCKELCMSECGLALPKPRVQETVPAEMWICTPKDKCKREGHLCWVLAENQVDERQQCWRCMNQSPKTLLKAYCLGMLVTEQSHCHSVTGQSRNIPQECLFFNILFYFV